jgi:hypothetical protein
MRDILGNELILGDHVMFPLGGYMSEGVVLSVNEGKRQASIGNLDGGTKRWKDAVCLGKVSVNTGVFPMKDCLGNELLIGDHVVFPLGGGEFHGGIVLRINTTKNKAYIGNVDGGTKRWKQDIDLIKVTYNNQLSPEEWIELYKTDKLYVIGMHPSLLMDKEFALALLTHSQEAYQYLPNELKYDLAIAIKVVKHKPYYSVWLPDELRNHRSIALTIVRNETDGNALYYLNDSFKDDEEIVLIAMEKSIKSLKYASPRLQEKFKDRLS